MTRYQRLRRADTAQQLDRETWASLDKLKFDSIIRGSGEYLIEDPPIYFGQAFDAPPFFTFSATTGGTVHPEVKAIGWPTAGVDRTKDELLNWGWLHDGSFEHQMVWNDPVIPTVKDHLTYSGFQKIVDDQAPGTAWKTPRTENWWVQGPAETSGSQPLWAISSEKAYPNANGYKSQYSARYVMDSSGQTRWLIPIYAWDESSPWIGYLSTDPDEWHLNDVVSWTSQVVMGGAWEGGYRPIAFNPPLDKWTVNLKVFATENITYETIIRQWDDLDNSYFGGTSYYRLIKEDTYTQEINANEWNEIEFTYGTSKYWPNMPVVDYSAELSDEWVMHTWMSRFTGGSAGTQVYVDDCYMWPNVSTAGGLPMITIGVAEWVQDEGGAYVGAKLWIKVGGTEVTVGRGGV